MNIFFTLLIALSVIEPAAFAHEGPSLVGNKICEALLTDENHWDLDQNDFAINKALIQRGIIDEALKTNGLCGPTCIVNALLGKPARSYPRELKEAKVAELTKLIQAAISDLHIPSDKILHMAYTGDIGQLLAIGIHETKNVVPNILYLGTIAFESSRTSPDFPIPEWIKGSKNIYLEDLKRTNQKNATLIALINIHRHQLPGSGVHGHFVIFDKIVQFKGHTFAFVRDPSSELGRYWVELIPSREGEMSTFKLISAESLGPSAPVLYNPEHVTVHLQAAVLATWPDQ